MRDPNMLAEISGDGWTGNHGEKCYRHQKSNLATKDFVYKFLLFWSDHYPNATNSTPLPRIDLVLTDRSRPDPVYLGKWHMFLPSDLHLIWNFQWSLSTGPATELVFTYFNFYGPRIHAMYTYDQALFHERWIGPPGVPRCNLRLLHAEGGAWVT